MDRGGFKCLLTEFTLSLPLHPVKEEQLRLILAPSPRILAYLARKAARESPTMALTIVAEVEQPAPKPEEFKPPPPVVTTPCDPWPRPYFLEDGLRKVYPYHYTYNTYCKERWRGKELLSIFATEFRDRPKEYYVRALFNMLIRRHQANVNML